MIRKSLKRRISWLIAVSLFLLVLQNILPASGQSQAFLFAYLTRADSGLVVNLIDPKHVEAPPQQIVLPNSNGATMSLASPSPDGRWVVLMLSLLPTEQTFFRLLDMSTGAMRDIAPTWRDDDYEVSGRSYESDFMPRWSPDSRYVALNTTSHTFNNSTSLTLWSPIV